MIKCFLRCLLDFLKYGVWIRHIYGEPKICQSNVITNGKTFRTSDSLSHDGNEKVYKNAYVATNSCKYCGRELKTWATDLRYLE